MAITRVGSEQNSSLVAVLTLSVTRPAGLAAGDILLAAVDTTLLAVSLTPPADWVAIQSNDASGNLTQTVYSHTVTDPSAEPASYTWTTLVATAMAIVLGAWRGALLGTSTGAASAVDATTISYSIPQPIENSWLVTAVAGIRLALAGAGTTWTISDPADSELEEVSNAIVVGVDLSAALYDSNRGLPNVGTGRTGQADLTQTDLVIAGILLTPSGSGSGGIASAGGAAATTSVSQIASTNSWPGTRAMAISPYADQAALNLDQCIGQRQATWTFILIHGPSGQRLGDLHPVRQPATLMHDTSRVIKRDLMIGLAPSDVAAIDPITDRVDVSMDIAGRTWPLGRYMFTDPTRLVDTGGDQGMYRLLDEMFLVDQQLEHGFSSTLAVDATVRALLAGLAIRESRIDATIYTAVGGWGAGTTRGQALAALATQGDYETPWIDHTGTFRMIRTVDPDATLAALDFDTGRRVLRSSISQTSDILNAPNRFVVIGNQGGEAEIVGTYDVPTNAPHSITNRGFVVAQVTTLQLASTSQAQAAARSLGLRQTVFERADLDTPPDPRHDSYDVIRWQGRNWLELAWQMTCQEGAPMRHSLRRALVA